MKAEMENHKLRLEEEIEQLKLIKKTVFNERGNIFGVLMSDDTIEECIEQREDDINELNQLLQFIYMYDDSLHLEDRMEIMERYSAIRNGIHHCLRRNMERTVSIKTEK